MTKGQ